MWSLLWIEKQNKNKHSKENKLENSVAIGTGAGSG
jgi:hypothetical protein